MALATIADIGRGLQRYGLRVGQHPEFGAVGGHAKNSHHDYGEAIDVTDWRADNASEYEGGQVYGWKERTRRLKERARQLGGFNEVLGPGDAGHDSHLHLALRGKRDWSDQQLEWLATGRHKRADGSYSVAMPGTTTGLQQAAGQSALERVERYEDSVSAQVAQPPVEHSSDPSEENYWKRADMQQWAGAHANLAQQVMARHGFDPSRLQQADNPGATAGVKNW